MPKRTEVIRARPLAIAYVRVSTADQAEHGASLDAQEAMLRDEAERRGWDVEIVREEGKSAKSITGRPLLTGATRLRYAPTELRIIPAVAHHEGESSWRISSSSCRISAGSSVFSGATATTVALLVVARAAARGSAASVSSR